MISINVRASADQVVRDLNAFARRQVPFATAKTLTILAREAAAAETLGLDDTFDLATPFTKRAFGSTSATKSTLKARVFARDIQAAYLEPFGPQGSRRQVLGKKRAILTPGAARLNQYGNLPKGKIAALKARPDVFTGPVTLNGKVINGVWQRGKRGGRRRKGFLDAGYGTKGNNVGKGLPGRTTLKLLVRFDDPAPVIGDLHYEERARAVVDSRFRAVFDDCLNQALATAR